MNIQIGRFGPLGRVVWGLFGLLFAAVGAVALWAMGHMVHDGVETYFWEPATCIVTSSGMEQSSVNASEYVVEVTYRYTWEGRRYSGDRLWPHYQDSSLTRSNAYLVAYPVGRSVGCYVDPEEPSEATLERPALWFGFMLLIPLVFLGIGLFVFAYACGWIFPDPARQQARPSVTSSAADGATANQALGCGMAFCALFVVAGVAVGIPFFVMPLLEWYDARDWPEVPATVMSSEVGVHRGDDSITHSVDIVFRYQVEGREYTSDRYHLVPGSSSGYDAKQEIVERYPPGAEVTAFVNPDNPGSAVLYRGFSAEWLIGLLPLLFIGAGSLGMFFLWRGRRSLGTGAGNDRGVGDGLRRRDRSRSLEEETLSDRFASLSAARRGPTELKPAHSPMGKLAMTLFFALIWNGVTGAGVWAWWGDHQQGGADGCLTLFLIPFVLIGVLLLISVPYQVLASFNPRPRVRIDRTLEPGVEGTLHWDFEGASQRIRRLRITILGEEKATYRQGTNTRTASQAFHRQVVVDTELEVARGSANLSLPEDTMHSFKSAHNEIVWHLTLHGDIHRWPDVNDTFLLTVHPKEVD